jgi:hypothetical protein
MATTDLTIGLSYLAHNGLYVALNVAFGRGVLGRCIDCSTPYMRVNRQHLIHCLFAFARFCRRSHGSPLRLARSYGCHKVND